MGYFLKLPLVISLQLTLLKFWEQLKLFKRFYVVSTVYHPNLKDSPHQESVF